MADPFVLPDPIQEEVEKDQGIVAPITSRPLQDAVREGQLSTPNMLMRAFQSDNITHNIVNGRLALEARRRLTTPDFELTEDLLKGTADAFELQGPARMTFIKNAPLAMDQRDLAVMARMVKEDHERMELMSEQGIAKSLLLAIPAVLLDPALIASGGVASGAGLLKWLDRGSRLQRMTRTAGVGAGAAGSQEAILSLSDSTREWKDVLTATVLGGLLGGGLGAAFGAYRKAGGEATDVSGAVDEIDGSLVPDRPLSEAMEPIARDHAMVPVAERPQGIFSQRYLPAPPDRAPVRVVEGEFIPGRPGPELLETRLNKRPAQTIDGQFENLDELAANPRLEHLDPDLLADRAGRMVADDYQPPRDIPLGSSSQVIFRARNNRIDVRHMTEADVEAQIGVLVDTRRWDDASDIRSPRRETMAERKAGKGKTPGPAEPDTTIRMPPEQRLLDDELNRRIQAERRETLRTQSPRASRAAQEAPEVTAPQGTIGDAPDVRPEAAGDDSVGAASSGTARVDDPINMDNIEDLIDEVDPKVLKGLNKLQHLRMGITKVLMGSPSSSVRALGALLVPDHVGLKDYTGIQNRTALEERGILESQMMMQSMRSISGSFHQWADAKGVSSLKRHAFLASKEWDEFNDLVFDAVVRGIDLGDVNVNRAASAVKKDLEAMLKRGQDEGIFSPDIDIDNYLPRILNNAKFQKMEGIVGSDGIRQWLAQALQNGTPGLGPEAARLMAKAWYVKLQNSAHGMEVTQFHGINMDNVEQIASILKDGGLNNLQVDYVLRSIRTTADNQGTIPRAKRRFRIDENTEVFVKVRNSETGIMETHSVKYSDLYETNTAQLVSQYTKRLSGAIALKRTIGIVGTDAEIENFARQARTAQLQAAPGKTARAETVYNASLMLMRHIAGKPMNPHELTSFGTPSMPTRISRTARQAAFSLYMGQSGFAALAELGILAAKGQWGIIWSSIRDYRTLIRDARTGGFSDEAVELVEEYFGIGGEDIINPHLNRFDDAFSESVEDFQGTKFERVMTTMQRVMAEKLSFLGPITRMTRRQMAFSIMHQMDKWANKRGDLTTAQKFRMYQMGLNESDLEKIQNMLRSHGVEVTSDYRKRNFTRANFESMRAAEPEMFAKWQTAVHREAHRTIIESQLGAIPVWAMGPVGAAAMQFLTFVLNAHEALFLRSISVMHASRMRDFETWAALGASMIFASGAYTIQQYLNTIGRPEARAEALSTENILKRSFARAGYAAFAPQITDFFTTALFDKAFFDARTTGLPSGQVSSIPVVSMADRMYTAAHGALSAATNDNRQFNRDAARAALGLIPLASSMVGIRGVNEYISSQLPRDATIDRDLE